MILSSRPCAATPQRRLDRLRVEQAGGVERGSPSKGRCVAASFTERLGRWTVSATTPDGAACAATAPWRASSGRCARPEA
jgi:hypothetical protein